MKNYLLSILAIAFLSACDDGDVIVTSFDFEEATLQACGGPGDYVFFKINSESAESLSLNITTSDTLFLIEGIREFPLTETTHTVNYRRFDGDVTADYFCNVIPPVGPNAAENYVSTGGTANIQTDITLDDNDGVALEDEFDGDTDMDGIPDFYDADDDGDNVLTSFELGDSDPTTPPRDTDGDGLPDYLDPDDDGDGILTIDEESIEADLDPTNDITDNTVGPDFLNAAVSIDVMTMGYRSVTYSFVSTGTIFITDLVLVSEDEQITQENLSLDSLPSVLSGTITITPEFPN